MTKTYYILKIKAGGKSKYVQAFWKGWELDHGYYRFWISAFLAKIKYRYNFPLREVDVVKQYAQSES